MVRHADSKGHLSKINYATVSSGCLKMAIIVVYRYILGRERLECGERDYKVRD